MKATESNKLPTQTDQLYFKQACLCMDVHASAQGEVQMFCFTSISEQEGGLYNNFFMGVSL